MKKRSEKVSKEKGSSGFEEEITKIGDDYQCSGILELDFPELCALAGVSEIPTVKLRQPTISSGSPVTTWCREPYLQIEKENGDSRTVKKVRVSGWMVDEVMARVLSKILPSLSNLQSLEMWRARLTDRTLTSLKNTITLCSNLRTVILDGNPIPGQAYYILLGEDSLVTHLSLRNNRIEEEGARLIGSALSTVHSTNRNLLSLNMAFNSIGDAGAIHIAQGLRLNRSLLCLSLANNHVGDSGAAHLAEVLGPFALTHEEIVERRRQLIMRDQLVDAPKRDEKPAAGQTGATAAKKEEHKMTKKGNKALSLCLGKSEEVVETLSPLLDPDVRHVEGKVIHPGNTALISLNLSGNKLTKQSLHMFLSLVGGQGEGGLLRLSLNRNNFPLDCEAFLNIQAMMSLKAPLIKAGSGQVDDEEGQAAYTYSSPVY
uniref:Uncharacterized protein n=1 Tax=Electrophorus electricus TaxID=8005 RepID=A0A4W4ENH7_ELEEL